MAWTTPKTWAYKESLASNDMNVYVRDNFNFLKSEIDNKILAGSGMLWFTDTAPTGWLLCRGQAVSRTTYSVLFAAIGTTYGLGDNSTTFNLPQGGGNVFVGKDAGQTEFDTLGKVGGTKAETLGITQIPSHDHNNWTEYTDTNHYHNGTTGGQSATHHHSNIYSSSGSNTYLFGAGGQNLGSIAGGDASNDHTHNFSTGWQSDAYATNNHHHQIDAQGGGQSHNNLQPLQVANYIIKY